MKQLIAFMKKEFLEQLRTSKIMILAILFCLFGIMNPAMAKIMPWLIELMSGQLAKSGMVINSIEVNAMTSWAQFFKNMPMLLIIFIVMFSGILTVEYQKGTLVNVITKGLNRWKVLASKLVIMTVLWTVGYLITFAITYGYNAYFWDNNIAQNLLFAAFGYYIVGLWLITVILLASTIFKSASTVTLFVGTMFVIAYLLGFIPKIMEYLPLFLMSSNELLVGTLNINQCFAAIGVTFFLMVLNISLSVIFFNKKTI